MMLFVALAVLESHRDVILRYLVEFDEILKVTYPSISGVCLPKAQLRTLQYCNELSMTIELDTTLAQTEVLFFSFRQSVRDRTAVGLRKVRMAQMVSAIVDPEERLD